MICHTVLKVIKRLREGQVRMHKTEKVIKVLRFLEGFRSDIC